MGDGSAEQKRQLLAELLRAQQAKERGDIARQPAGPQPLSPSQERLWFVDRLRPGHSLYTMAPTFELHGTLNVPALEAALTEILRRHESLRTAFTLELDGPRQTVVPLAPVKLAVTDLSKTKEGPEQTNALTQARLAHRRLPLNLATGELTRFALVALSPTRHVLLTSVHHIATDGWSRNNLFAELTALYPALAAGGAPASVQLPALSIQYSDYASHLSAGGDAAARERDLAFWKEKLDGLPTLLPLPTDAARPAVRSDEGRRLQANVSAGLAQKLNTFARSRSITPFMVLLAAYEAWLFRITGQSDFAVGTPTANRPHPQLEPLIGFFVNMLPLRARVQGSATFEQLVTQARTETLASFDHQGVPFTKLVEAVAPVRDLSHTPIFQVSLTVQPPPLREKAAGAVTFRLLGDDTEFSEYDLSLTFEPEGDGFNAWFDFNTDLFETRTVQGWAKTFFVLLDDALSRPTESLLRLRMLEDVERKGLLALGPERQDTRADETFLQRFHAQLSKTPSAPAVTFEGETLTYAQLGERVRRVAAELRAKGAGPERVVGVCVERSVSMLVAMLGVMEAGAAYLPLDPSYPADRLRYMLEDARASFVLCTDASLQQFGELQTPALKLETLLRSTAADTMAPALDARNLAYVIYTSGSTGRPKGVLLTQGNLSNFLSAMDTVVPGSAKQTWLAVTSISFDIHVLELLWTLTRGMHVVIQREHASGEFSIAGNLARHPVSHLQCTPSLMKILLEDEAATRALADVDVLLLGGEALPETVALRLREFHRGQLLNMFGPTETTVWSSTANVYADRLAIRLGQPLRNTTFHVLDEELEPVPVGVAGELYIGGDGVARGYHQRAELTAERFVPDVSGTTEGGRLYRTGDRVRWRADGTLEYLSRIDHQLKLRGYRVELGEIENALRRLPGLRDAAVITRQDSGDVRLHAYVVPSKAGDKPGADGLRRELLTKLPEYMVPALFTVLDALPLTPNGKVDRNALPRDAGEKSDAGTSEYVAPRDTQEELLAAIFSQALGIERVGINDHFFERGGHSLLAAQAAAKIGRLFGVDLPLQALFQAPRVRELASVIRTLRQSGSQHEAPKLMPLPKGEVASLSPAQERMWFLQQLQPGSTAYNLPDAVHLHGPLDVVKLGQAVRRLVERHDVFRATVQSKDGQSVLRLLPPEALSLELVDFSALALSERDRTLAEDVDREARRPFDLQTGPLARFRLYRVADQHHVLLVVMHHIVTDGWTLGIVGRELLGLYQQNDASLASAPTLQYADVAHWQRQWLESSQAKAQLEFWRQALEGAPGLLELPTDRPRPAVLSDQGARSAPLRFSRQLTQGLRRLAHREGVTSFILLEAAFAALLYRYSRQSDLTIGTPVGGRPLPEMQSVAGLFVNTLVLRTKIQPSAPFRALLGQVRQDSVESYANADLPFEKLVEALQPIRSLSHSPLFQVLFRVDHAEGALAHELRALGASEYRLDTGTSKFDLSLTVTDAGEQMAAEFEYSTDLFDVGTVERMLRHYQTMLESVVAKPDTRVSELSLLPERERHEAVAAGGQTEVPYNLQTDVIQLFEGWVAKTPTAKALSFGSEASWTYEALDAWAQRWSDRLVAAGAKAESVVAVLQPREPELLATMLGIWKSQSAYLPLDPAQPPARLAQVLTESAAQLIVITPELEGTAKAAIAAMGTGKKLPGIVIAESKSEKAEKSKKASPRTVLPRGLACVIFTSGSTGTPKGAMLDHAGVLNHIYGLTETLGLHERDVIAQTASQVFDISVWQLVTALTVGGRTHMVEDEISHDPTRLLQKLESWGITIAELVPSVLRPMLEHTAADKFPSLAALRWMIPTGEAIPPELCRNWFSRYPSIPLINAYGPCECSDDVTLFPMREPPTRATTPIGKPMQNMEVHVLDDALQPVPVNVVGELCVGGVGVGRGYLNRPDLTADKFLPDPFSSTPGARLYRSGDLGRRLPDGTLEFLGRRDFQVKIRGFRIELEEIEAGLERIDGVREAVVAAREDRPGDKRLVAYVTLDHAGIKVDALREALEKKLPAYMVPSQFVVLEKLPLSSNGKVDRKALPAPVATALGEGEGQVPFRHAVEEMTAKVWAQLLGVSRLSPDDNFFNLGGHSLLAVQLAARLQKILGVPVPLKLLFEAPTLGRLSDALLKLRQAGAGVDDRAVVKVDRSKPVRASFAQERMWLLEQLLPGSYLYTVYDLAELHGELDVPTMNRAVTELVRRHESLRTTFREEGGRPVQLVQAAGPVSLPVVDLSTLPADTREAELQRVIREEGHRAFNLATGPLIRFTLVRTAPQAHVFLIAAHHIVTDGWSTGLAAREIGQLYSAFLENRPSPLAEPPIQYADFSQWQRAWLEDGHAQTQLTYWKDALAGAPNLLEVPTDFARPVELSPRGARTKERTLSPKLTKALRQLSQDQGVTLFMMLWSGFAALLNRYARQDDVVIGTPVGGRRLPETEGLIGLFVNTLVLRSQFQDALTFRELLDQARATALGAYAHSDLPFERLVEALQPERSLSYTPLFQAMFSLERTDGSLVDGLSTLKAKPLRPESDTAKFDLSLTVVENGDGLVADLEFSTDLYTSRTAERMLEQYERLLEAAIATPDRAVAALSLVAPGAETLKAAPASSREIPSVVAQFEAAAAKHPKSHALVMGSDALNYEQLDARANALAHRLIAQGVKAETRVGLCVERSPNMVVGMLAVLKAGGAYVPLDPSYPSERLQLMLEDSGATVLLTTSAHARRFPSTAAKALLFEDDAPLKDAPGLKSKPSDAALILFTSGSSGRPKGTVLEHGGVANFVDDIRQRFALEPEDRLLQFGSMGFDIHLEEIFPTFAVGGCLVLREEGMTDTMPGFLDACARARVTVLDLPTAFFGELCSQMASGKLKLPSTVRLCVIGGERAAPERVALFKALAPGIPLLNNYGPTECTSACLSANLTEWDGLSREVPIGRPMQGQTAYVLDGALQPLPPGMPGELCIGGIGVARGYVGLPELTAERFVPDPFSSVTGARLYRTGDAARWREDGQLEFLGRLDTQIKIRGFRIEPGEVEAAIRALPHVSDAAVAAQKSGGAHVLTAWVVADGNAFLEPAWLRAELSKTLPPFMVPAAWSVVPRIPRTLNGKVDVRSLPSAVHTTSTEGLTPPRTQLEATVAQTWREVLGVEKVGLESSFFELGGHSLLATQLISRLKQSVGAQLSLRRIFENPQLGEMAKELAIAQRGGSGEVLKVTDRSRPIPASSGQERMWVALEMSKDFWFIITAVLKLQGKLDEGAMSRALNALVERQEVLRTVMHHDGKALWQVIRPFAPVEILRTDLSNLESETRARTLRELLDREEHTRFDLAKGPLYRFEIIKLGTDEHVLFLKFSHLVVDGLGSELLLSELSDLYLHETEKAAVPPKPAFHYADYAAWHTQWLGSSAMQESVEHWRKELVGLPPLLEIPTDSPREPGLAVDVDRTPVKLSAEATSALKSLAQREGVTPFMLLAAAYQCTLARLSGQQEVVIGTPFSARGPQTEEMVGHFANMVALRADLPSGTTFKDTLAQSRRRVLDAEANQHVPFELLIERLKIERDAASTAVFQVLFLFENAPPPSFGRFDVAYVPSTWAMPNFDFTLELFDTSQGRIEGALGYNKNLYRAETARRVASAFTVLLEHALRAPELPVAQLDTVSAAQRVRLLDDWNNTRRDYTQGEVVHAPFERQVALAPDALAVLFGQQRLTYAELDRRANALANHLRSLGIRLETRVGLMVSPNAEVIVALLGILKSGAAYVPLDPEWPEERLRIAYDAAEVSLVVTQDKFEGLVLKLGRTSLCIDRDWSTIARAPTTKPEEWASPHSLAYIIFTSGSTGEPKGVLVEHGSVVNHNLAVAEAFRLVPGDRMLQFVPVNFDAAGEDIYPPLATGGVVVMREGLVAANKMNELLERDGVTVVSLPPTYIHEWATELDKHGNKVPACVRLVIPGGDLIRPETWRIWQNIAGERVPWINVYGPTETTVTAALCDIPGREGIPETGNFPIGRPIANARMYLLDRQLQLVPPGATGEIYIAGKGLARGYLGRPEQTAEKFLPDPFATEPGARMYKTGDLARHLPDGRIEFVGRVDNQVKIRGFRVELAEVEAKLGALPHVGDVAVLVRDDAGTKRLIAYAAGDLGKVTETSLREKLGEILPRYMVPSSIVLMDALPLSPNGKVDRRALAKLEKKPGASVATDTATPGATPEKPVKHVAPPSNAPRTSLELQIAQIWEEILNVRPIEVNQSFFDIGGESLLAMQVVAMVEERMGITLPLQLVFEAQTVAEFAAAVEEFLIGATTRRAVVPLSPANVDTAGKTPLHFFHPLDGEVHHFLYLARMLEGSFASSGFVAPEVYSGETFDSLEARVDHYVNELRKLQPEGPYHLVGYSSGGYLAYAAAAALERAGQKVALLALVDTRTNAYLEALFPPEAVPTLNVKLAPDVMGYVVAAGAEAVAGYSANGMLEQIAGLSAEEQWNRIAERGKEIGEVPGYTRGKDLSRQWKLQQIIVPESNRYQVPTLANTTVLLLRSSESKRWGGDEKLGWPQVTKSPIDVVDVPGVHADILMPPNVEEVGKSILAWLGKGSPG